MPQKPLYRIRRRSSPGAAPGTMIAPEQSPFPVIDVIAFDEADYIEARGIEPAELEAIRRNHRVTWVNVSGLGDAGRIAQIGRIFGLHSLAMEDVLNLHQRPKAEEYSDYVFIVSQMSRTGTEFGSEQLSLFLGKDFALSFQEAPGDCLDPLRERIRQGKGRIRSSGPDYLCYAILDAVIDNYFPVMERFGEALERLEDMVVTRPAPGHIRKLHELKRELLSIRRAVWPHREMINAVIRDENPLVASETRVYLRDVYDHTIQLMDFIETYREIGTGLVDVHISSISARLNEIMKVLTIIATIFIPLGFVASLYGMNFDRTASPWNMPELGWRFGYPISLLFMGAIAGGLLYYFRHRGWLGDNRRDR